MSINSIVRRCARKARSIADSERISGCIMLSFALAALILANLPQTSRAFEALAHFSFAIPGTNVNLSLEHWAQDGVLTIFFLVVGFELRQEFATGSLANPKAAAVPMLCAVGGMVTPAFVFVAVVAALSSGVSLFGGELPAVGGVPASFSQLAQGWAVPTATDIAFSLTILSLFGKVLPSAIRAFVMTLATVDDLLAVMLIAVFFSQLHEWYWFVGIVVCACGWYIVVRLSRVLRVVLIFVALALWFMMFEAGIHPTLAGVIIGLLTPAHSIHSEPVPRAIRFAHAMQPFSALVALPIFAFFAAGVHFAGASVSLLYSPVVLGIIAALVVGKPLGILTTAWLSTHFTQLHLPQGLRVKDMVGVSFACGIGFTVSFLIAALAFTDGQLSAQARFGVLVASCIAAGVAAVVLHMQSKRYLAQRQGDIAESVSL